jgi:hypothetical protein
MDFVVRRRRQRGMVGHEEGKRQVSDPFVTKTPRPNDAATVGSHPQRIRKLKQTMNGEELEN